MGGKMSGGPKPIGETLGGSMLDCQMSENLVKELRGFQHNSQLSTHPGGLPAGDPVQRLAAPPGRAGGLAQGRGHSGRATAPPGTGVLHPVLSETILQVSEVLHGLTRPQVFAMRQQTQVHLMSVDWDNVEVL